ncbi:DNA/RNA polymerases superfamily protein [Gossypium australe]|uniref:DNA/RNA polymerases superfamily protein n=1 Tax=Gossypium australe TaxID=47621 RepID=A0A5B6VQ30_9ROSI|nr:DNA/RNA polymerases superfamily protein [Gossypium australe]
MTQKELNLWQKRWLELIKDYELVIDYHPGKANVVADALSRKSLFVLRAMNTRMALPDDGSILAELRARPMFLQDNCEAQKGDNNLQAKRVQCSTKMYNDLRKWYCWPSMKKDISESVSRCLICQQVKAKHQVPSGLLQPIMVPEWKWDHITMDFVTSLPLTPKKKDVIWVVVDRLMKSAHFIPVRIDYSLDKLADFYVSEIVRLHGVPLSIISNRDPSFQLSLKMAFYEVLYGRKCRTPLYWTELRENQIYGVDLVRETEKKVKVIRECLKATSNIQKSYADLKRKDIEFRVGDKVFLKLSPWKKVLRFGRKGKLSLRFIGPSEITERIGLVAYRLALPSELEKIHDVFHVSMLCRYHLDPSHVIVSSEVEIQPVKILAREVKQLRNKSISLVKVLWQRHRVEEATWELEEAMRNQYPNLFTGKIFREENP